MDSSSHMITFSKAFNMNYRQKDREKKKNNRQKDRQKNRQKHSQKDRQNPFSCPPGPWYLCLGPRERGGPNLLSGHPGVASGGNIDVTGVKVK